MSQRGLFIRTVVVEAGAPGQKGQRYAGLRTAFQIEHKAGGAASRGRIELYNAGAPALAVLRQRTNTVQLKVGYDGDERLLFRGNPMRDGVELQVTGDGDRVIHVEASDGGRGTTNTHIVKSYARSVAMNALLDEILDSTGWSLGQIDLPPSATTGGPLVVYQRPDEILDRIGEILVGTDPRGFDWQITDNELHIIRRDGVRASSGVLISQREGNLIGSPTATRTGVKVRALIDATLRPLQGIQVQSDLVNGYFRVTDVTFSGDNWSNEFYMDITAKTIQRTP